MPTFVKFTQTESNDVDTSRVFVGIEAASAHLRRATLTAPEGGGYDKTWFEITVVVDGAEPETYKGRLDLTRNVASADLAAHVRSHCEWLLSERAERFYVGRMDELALARVSAKFWDHVAAAAAAAAAVAVRNDGAQLGWTF